MLHVMPFSVTLLTTASRTSFRKGLKTSALYSMRYVALPSSSFTKPALTLVTCVIAST